MSQAVVWQKRRTLLGLFVFGLIGCAARPPDISRDTIHLTSAGFPLGGTIPTRYTCDGSNRSPPLTWSAAPPRTKSFALVVTDRDSALQFLFGPFVHWIVYNIPPETRRLHEGVEKLPALADGTRQGINGFDKVGFGGPCPPGSGTHRYTFAIYALDAKLRLPSGVQVNMLDAAMQGHALVRGTLVGRYR